MGGAVFVWENLGPTHDDRLRAVAATGIAVTAVQFSGKSATYSWESIASGDYRAVTLCAAGERVLRLALAWRLIRAIRRSGAHAVFLCHYEMPAVLLAAIVTRICGKRVYAMIDSKFDDYPRRVGREMAKSLFLLPYHGAVTASLRSRDYLAFLGLNPARIALGYDTLDTARIAGQASGVEPTPFERRDFLIVARLVPKKNIAAALEAFAAFVERNGSGRRLRICGDGPLESELKARAEALGIGGLVDFAGFVQTREVSEAMARALALILPSVEEQFGLVINEALSMGLPVICSINAGAADVLVDNLVNGFLVSPHESATIAGAMEMLHRDPALHERMAAAAAAAAPRGDARLFADAVGALTDTATKGFPAA
ncbi:MAG: glycosyltransferase family 4 protein [Novosphingobium sp.]|nr:glycosyltransferase family 4 protein [Novosphingobium sp.]